LYAQIPDGEIEIGNKCDRKIRPAGGKGFNKRMPPFEFPSHDGGTVKRQRPPQVETKATDSRFTQIRQSER
jgi:hypothetical protein